MIIVTKQVNIIACVLDMSFKHDVFWRGYLFHENASDCHK